MCRITAVGGTFRVKWVGIVPRMCRKGNPLYELYAPWGGPFIHASCWGCRQTIRDVWVSMRSSDQREVKSRADFTPPPPAHSTPASSTLQGLSENTSEAEQSVFFLFQKKAGHEMRFISAGGKKEKLDPTCWRWWITQRGKWWASTTGLVNQLPLVFVTVTKQMAINVDVFLEHFAL